MRIKLLIVGIFVIFAVGITLSMMIISHKNIAEVDLVAINDVPTEKCFKSFFIGG